MEYAALRQSVKLLQRCRNSDYCHVYILQRIHFLIKKKKTSAVKYINHYVSL
uniref:Uncharacterized protein n=1 Tax=Anguilla anguilla TaxID=7936 RepID=A0A0E9XVY9_ANGAN